MQDVSARIRLFRSTPSISVSLASSRMRRHASSASLSNRSASAPLPAVATANPFLRNIISNAQRMSGSSSTTSTVRHSAIRQSHCQRQANDKRAALSLATFHSDDAPVLLDDRMADREPQAGALADRPG